MSVTTTLSDDEKLHLPEDIEADRASWLAFFERMVSAQRHEDTLLHARVQGFMVATALLMAAVSQFKEAKFLYTGAIICLFGIVLSLTALQILKRTARTIDWYLDGLVRLEPLLFPNHRQRVYEGRRRLLQELHLSSNASIPPPVSSVLGGLAPPLGRAPLVVGTCVTCPGKQVVSLFKP